MNLIKSGSSKEITEVKQNTIKMKERITNEMVALELLKGQQIIVICVIYHKPPKKESKIYFN